MGSVVDADAAFLVFASPTPEMIGEIIAHHAGVHSVRR
jgi:hypothetical protein